MKNKFFLFLILFLISILIKKKEKFNNNLIKNLNNINKNNTIIIIGKGPNLNDFIKNYDKFKNFKKIGLNNSILTKEIKFDYYFQQDFTLIYPSEYIKKTIGNLKYSDKVVSNIKNNKIDNELNFKYAFKNNIKPIIPDIKFENGKTPDYNTLPNFISNYKKKINRPKFRCIKKNIINIDKDIIYIPKNSPRTCAVNAILWCIKNNYKNIFLSGITMFNKKEFRVKYKLFLKILKKKYPDIKIYCLYPLKDSEDIFDFNIK